MIIPSSISLREKRGVVEVEWQSVSTCNARQHDFVWGERAVPSSHIAILRGVYINGEEAEWQPQGSRIVFLTDEYVAKFEVFGGKQNKMEWEIYRCLPEPLKKYFAECITLCVDHAALYGHPAIWNGWTDDASLSVLVQKRVFGEKREPCGDDSTHDVTLQRILAPSLRELVRFNDLHEGNVLFTDEGPVIVDYGLCSVA